MSSSPITLPVDETRSRLLDAATIIFSELGFQRATTRMICERAQANPAAVNYHFRDKFGLYSAVLTANFGKAEGQQALEMDEAEAQQLLAMESEAALGAFIARLFSGLKSADVKWRYMRIMANELSHPTAALPTVVERFVRPQAGILCEIVARLTGHDAESRKTKLAAQSILAQVMHHINGRPIITLLWPDMLAAVNSNEEIIAHITQFSLNGLRAL